MARGGDRPPRRRTGAVASAGARGAGRRLAGGAPWGTDASRTGGVVPVGRPASRRGLRCALAREDPAPFSRLGDVQAASYRGGVGRGHAGADTSRHTLGDRALVERPLEDGGQMVGGGGAG